MSAGGEGGRTGELLELTSARGFAALAVLVYHIDAYCSGTIGQYVPTAYFGPLAVDFFFALSGFVLTHVYRESWEEGRYRHGPFLIRRFARIWPLHMACLIGVGAIVLVGSRVGITPPWTPTWSSFLTHAAMLHATGLSPEKAWNQPSWSVSAEWTAYLVFPLYLIVVGWFRQAAGKIVLAIVTIAGMGLGTEYFFGGDIFSMTTLGAVRIIPMFLAGVALRETLALGHGLELTSRALNALILGCAAALYAGMAFQIPMMALWLGLLAMLYLLALRALRSERSILRSRPTLWLGDVSYALYLVHAPVLMVVYGLGAKLLGVSSETGMVGLGGVVLTIAIMAAALGHYLVELPAQRLILRVTGQRRPPAVAEVAPAE